MGPSSHQPARASRPHQLHQAGHHPRGRPSPAPPASVASASWPPSPSSSPCLAPRHPLGASPGPLDPASSALAAASRLGHFGVCPGHAWPCPPATTSSGGPCPHPLPLQGQEGLVGHGSGLPPHPPGQGRPLWRPRNTSCSHGRASLSWWPRRPPAPLKAALPKEGKLPPLMAPPTRRGKSVSASFGVEGGRVTALGLVEPGVKFRGHQLLMEPTWAPLGFGPRPPCWGHDLVAS